MAVLVMIAIFWALRAVEQALFFGVRRPVSVAFLTTFVAGSVLDG